MGFFDFLPCCGKRQAEVKADEVSSHIVQRCPKLACSRGSLGGLRATVFTTNEQRATWHFFSMEYS